MSMNVMWCWRSSKTCRATEVNIVARFPGKRRSKDCGPFPRVGECINSVVVFVAAARVIVIKFVPDQNSAAYSCGWALSDGYVHTSGSQ